MLGIYETHKSIYCDDCLWEFSAKRNWHNKDLTKEEWKNEKRNI
tara:strand:+ start:3473 stop:3604 length:132 start_codon:yes stop_codon:yes gene_type:complete